MFKERSREMSREVRIDLDCLPERYIDDTDINSL
jgi:hypothetical protein